MRVCVISRTVASEFFKPTTCGEVGGHVSWSKHCFNLSLSDVREPRADFMVACTAATREKEGSFNCKPICIHFRGMPILSLFYDICFTTHFIIGA